MKLLYTLVGMQYRDSVAIVASMKAGEPLALKRDKLNEADPWAIAVYHGERHIAFIKGTEVRALANRMDELCLIEIGGIFAVSADRWPAVEVDAR